MSGDARISGQIRITPPITWGELHDQDWALGNGLRNWPDALVKLATTVENTPTGQVHHQSGVAIVPFDGETNGYTLTEDVARIVRHFATAPDGTPRRFAGFLHLVWADGEEVYRVVPVDGGAIEVRPQVVWPEGARDEDGAQ